MRTHLPVTLVASSLLLPVLFAAGCGRQELKRRSPDSFESSENAIRGGSTDNGHDAVALLYNDFEGYICSGTIIDEKTFLTAGHCVEDGNANHYQIGVPVESLRKQAIEWSVTRGARSGRVAWQFIQEVAGQLGKKLE